MCNDSMKNPLLTKKNIRRITEFFNSERGMKLIPYGLGAKYISWFCNTDFAIQRFFKKKLPIVLEFLETFTGKWDERQVKSGFFTMNYLHGWRSSSISHMSGMTFKRRVKITGLDVFKQLYDEKKGIILLGTHYGLPAASFSIFPRLGYSNFYTILGEKGAESVKFKGMHAKMKPKVLVFKRGGESDAFSMLFEAKELLEKGNILHLLGDGSHGRASHTLNFLGKLRGYRATFAELALLTDSPIIPVFITPEKGKIIVDISTPLDLGDPEADREERVQNIVQQYSDLLEEKWMENPSFINGGFMEMYNRLIQA